MSENDERSPDEQPDGSAPREAEDAAGPELPPEVPEEARDYLERFIDARVAAVYAETWPAVLETVVEKLAERVELDPEQVAGRAADIAQATMERSAEVIKRRLLRDTAGAGGSDGRASDGGGDGGGGDGGGDDASDDLRALGDLPDEPGRATPRPVSSGRRDMMLDGVLTGLSRIFEDPAGFLTATIDAYVKVKQARAAPADDLALAQGLYERKPWLFDVFGKTDPLEERIPAMSARAFDVGLKVGSSSLGQALRDFVQGKGRTRRRFNPFEDVAARGRDVDVTDASAADATPAADRVPPEPATAPAAQDLRPTRGKLRKAA